MSAKWLWSLIRAGSLPVVLLTVAHHTSNAWSSLRTPQVRVQSLMSLAKRRKDIQWANETLAPKACKRKSRNTCHSFWWNKDNESSWRVGKIEQENRWQPLDNRCAPLDSRPQRTRHVDALAPLFGLSQCEAQRHSNTNTRIEKTGLNHFESLHVYFMVFYYTSKWLLCALFAILADWWAAWSSKLWSSNKSRASWDENVSSKANFGRPPDLISPFWRAMGLQRRQTWTHFLTMSSHYVSVYLTKCLVIISHWISVTHRDTVTRWHGDTGISAFLLRSQAVLGQVTQARARQEMIAACTRAGALPGYVVRKGPF